MIAYNMFEIVSGNIVFKVKNNFLERKKVCFCLIYGKKVKEILWIFFYILNISVFCLTHILSIKLLFKLSNVISNNSFIIHKHLYNSCMH
jgi:hypothetical protein